MLNWLRSLLCPSCPVLRGKDAVRLLEDMDNPKPCGPVPTPKLEEALRKIEEAKDAN